MLSLICARAQEESLSKSEDIKWGLSETFKIQIPIIISGNVTDIPMIRMESSSFMRSRLRSSA
jgi:hypothetical protein